MIFFLVFKIDTQIHTQKINEKDSQNTLTQNSNTQKIENSNTNLNLWVFLGAYVCRDAEKIRFDRGLNSGPSAC